MKGISAYVCIGRHGGFGIKRDGPSIRIVFGRIGFAIVLYDLECAMKILYDRCQELEKQAAEHNQSPRRTL